MKVAITYITVLIAFVVLSPHGYSQTDEKVLEGITSVRVVASISDEDGSACGLREEGLSSAASFPIITSPLDLSDESEFVLVVSSSARETSVGCTGSFRVRLLTFQFVVLDGTNLRKWVTIDLWNRGGLIAGPKGRFSSRLGEAIEVLTKTFIVDWTLDQQ